MLDKLKILLQEDEEPFFSDEQLKEFLEDNDNKVYKTASELCYLKSNSDSKVIVGPITIESEGADYWIRLAEQYAKKSQEIESDSDNTSSGGYYINRLSRG